MFNDQGFIGQPDVESAQSDKPKDEGLWGVYVYGKYYVGWTLSRSDDKPLTYATEKKADIAANEFNRKAAQIPRLQATYFPVRYPGAKK